MKFTAQKGCILFLAQCFLWTSLGFVSHQCNPHHPQRILLASSSFMEGLAEDFERLVQIDETIQSLKQQLPRILTKPLTAITAEKVYAKDVQLTVLVPDDNNDDEQDDIVLSQNREELIALSDVLVLATTAAAQANAVWGGGEESTSTNVVQCQLIVDDTMQSIRIPWKTKVPLLGSTNTNNRLEGLSELIFNDSGKLKLHRIRNVTWNGQAVNGPTIGRALKATQSAVGNLQQSPFFQNFIPNGGATLFNDLRDGLLEQAATAVSARVSQKGELTAPEIIHVASIQESTEWIEKKNSTNVQTTSIPSPGSKDWNEYATAHSSMIRFLEQVIPMLSGGSNIDPSLFDSNVTFFSVDGSLLMNGNTTVSNFYQSLALARRGTGGSWTLNRCSLLDWRNRIISVDYEASNNIPPWTIQGRDIYTLISSDGEERPIVQRIQQEKFSASNPDGTLTLDNKWLMNNLVGAVERGRLSSGTQDILSELFAQKASVTALSKRRPKLSRSVAANVYYIMSDLHERVETLLNDTSNRLPPAAEFMVEEVELHGYLGETLIRGSNSYNRFFGTLEAALYQSISQKRLVVEKRIPPRVELTPKGDIRLSLTMHFRLPPPILSDSPVMSGVPLQFELVSDYKIDPDTGFVNQHRLIATRVNGQLTPGDLLSRWIQKLLNFEDNIEFIDGGNEDVLKSFSDALSWFRTLASK